MVIAVLAYFIGVLLLRPRNVGRRLRAHLRNQQADCLAHDQAIIQGTRRLSWRVSIFHAGLPALVYSLL